MAALASAARVGSDEFEYQAGWRFAPVSAAWIHRCSIAAAAAAASVGRMMHGQLHHPWVVAGLE